MTDSHGVSVKNLLISSPHYFIQKVFGYRVDGMHGQIIDHLLENKYGLVLAPRGHGKSKILQGIITWRIVNDPNCRVVLVSDTDTKAQMFLRTIKAMIDNSPVLRDNYGELKGDRWTDHAITIEGRTEIHTEPSLLSVGAGSGGVTGMHSDFIMIDDIVSYDSSRNETQRQRIKDWYRTTLLPVLLSSGNISVCGCLPTDSKILMCDGTWNNIQDINIGDGVYSFDIDKSELVVKSVEDVIYQGVDLIFEVKTYRSTVKANKIHPFLTLEPTDNYISNGERYKFFDFKYKWKQLQDLKVGDLLLTISEVESNDVYDFTSSFSSDLCWLFGFMVGDGWITENVRNNGLTDKDYTTYKVCFSSGIYDKLDEKVLNIFKQEFDIDFKMTSGRYYLSTSKKIGKFFIENGLKKGAKNKDIPDWIFRSSLENRRSFIQGLLDADGTIRNRKFDEDKTCNSAMNWGIEVSSEKLIRDLKLLCYTCGYKSTLIRYRERLCQPPNSPEPILGKSWSIGISFNNELLGMLQQKGLKKFPIDNFRFERVNSINCVGQDDIWDLTVADTHNFITEGFITHNTRYHYSDFYDMIINDLEYPTLILPALNQDGTALCEWLVPLHDRIGNDGKVKGKGLLSIKKDLGPIIFALQYSNNTDLLKEGNIFRNEWIHYYDDLEFRNGKVFVRRGTFVTQIKKIIIGVDLAISQKEQAAHTVITVVGQGEDKKLYVLEVIGGKFTYQTQKDKIRAAVERWNPTQTVVESVAYQAVMIEDLRSEGGLKIKPFKTVTDKVARAMGMQGYFENGNIYFRKNMENEVDELLIFPDGIRKDFVDSLGFAVSGFKQVSGEFVMMEM